MVNKGSEFIRGDQKVVIGYTSGVFDLFHIGHLNLLKNAAGLCDKLVVGVTTDELVAYKNKRAVIPHHERMEIVRIKMWEKIKFDIMFVGDDWFNSPKWNKLDQQFKEVGVKIIYFPYTKGSTLINETLEKLRKG